MVIISSSSFLPSFLPWLFPSQHFLWQLSAISLISYHIVLQTGLPYDPNHIISYDIKSYYIMICYITIYHVILYHCVSYRILPYLVNYLILILIFFFPSYDCGARTSCRFKILHSRFRAFHDTSWALRTSREGVRRRRVSSDHPWCLVTSTLKKGTFKYWKENLTNIQFFHFPILESSVEIFN